LDMDSTELQRKAHIFLCVNVRFYNKIFLSLLTIVCFPMLIAQSIIGLQKRKEAGFGTKSHKAGPDLVSGLWPIQPRPLEIKSEQYHTQQGLPHQYWFWLVSCLQLIKHIMRCRTAVDKRYQPRNHMEAKALRINACIKTLHQVANILARESILKRGSQCTNASVLTSIFDLPDVIQK